MYVIQCKGSNFLKFIRVACLLTALLVLPLWIFRFRFRIGWERWSFWVIVAIIITAIIIALSILIVSIIIFWTILIIHIMPGRVEGSGWWKVLFTNFGHEDHRVVLWNFLQQKQLLLYLLLHEILIQCDIKRHIIKIEFFRKKKEYRKPRRDNSNSNLCGVYS